MYVILHSDTKIHRRADRTDLLYKYHNAPFKYRTKHHFVTEMCTHVHISVTKWCIVRYLSDTSWDLRDGSNRCTQSYIGGFPSQMASDAERVSMPWHHRNAMRSVSFARNWRMSAGARSLNIDQFHRPELSGHSVSRWMDINNSKSIEIDQMSLKPSILQRRHDSQG